MSEAHHASDTQSDMPSCDTGAEECCGAGLVPPLARGGHVDFKPGGDVVFLPGPAATLLIAAAYVAATSLDPPEIDIGPAIPLRKLFCVYRD